MTPSLLHLHPATVSHCSLDSSIHCCSHCEVIHFTLLAALRSLLLEIPDLKGDRALENLLMKGFKGCDVFSAFAFAFFIHLGPHCPLITWMCDHVIIPRSAQVIFMLNDICYDGIWHHPHNGSPRFGSCFALCWIYSTEMLQFSIIVIEHTQAVFPFSS